MLLKTTWRLWYDEKVLRSMLTSLFHHRADLCRITLLSISSRIPHCCSHVYLSKEGGREGGGIRNIRWVPPNVLLRVSGSTVLWTNPLIWISSHQNDGFWVKNLQGFHLSPDWAWFKGIKTLWFFRNWENHIRMMMQSFFLFNQLPPSFSVDNCWVSRSAFFHLPSLPPS